MLQSAIRLPFGWVLARDTPARHANTSGHTPRRAPRDIFDLPPRLQCDLGVSQLCHREAVANALDYHLRFML